ncbi:MAG: hypothetical protein GX800_04935 [Clostridiaceae bacterium]|nr:hypothetical protein [Clostridiaceae bacterium]
MPIAIRRPIKKQPYKLIVVSVCFFLLLVGTITIYAVTLADNKILNGVTICGIEVGKMTVEQASEIVSQQLSGAMDDQIVNVKFNEISYPIDISDKISFDISSSVNNAFLKGREGNILERLFFVFNNNKDILLEVRFEENLIKNEIRAFAAQVEKGNQITQIDMNKKIAKIDLTKTGFLVGIKQTYDKLVSNSQRMVFSDVEAAILDEITPQYLYDRINQAPKDAKYEVADNRYIIHEHKFGVAVDYTDLANKIESGEKVFTLGVTITEPKVTTDKLKGSIFADTLGVFITHYNQSNVSRSKNIAIATGKINGVVIGVGEEFSFNKVVGERSYKNGYQDANVYVGGKIEQGVGGGICQVSSTLYSAQLYADLQTVYRQNHMFTVSYLPLGQDATVVWGAVDYIFKNNTDYPIKITAAAQNGTLTVKILGASEQDGQQMIKIANTTISSTQPKERIVYTEDLPPGQSKIEQPGQNGAVVDTYKVYLHNGVEKKRVLLHRSTYTPMERIILVGKSSATGTEYSGDENPIGENDGTADDDDNEPPVRTEVGDVEKPPTVLEEFLSEDGL